MPDIAAALERIVLFIVPLMLGVVCHEVAHGYVAYLQGDATAKNAGRLTLNPIKHLDPMGSLVFVLTALTGAFVIGWAKPVPVNPGYFRSVRRGMALVSVAGPATNLLLAGLFAALWHASIPLIQASGGPMLQNVLIPLNKIFEAGVVVNLILAFFNLLPVPPLDGSKIIASILPASLANQYLSIERYGFIILIVLLFTGVLGKVLLPVIRTIYVTLL